MFRKNLLCALALMALLTTLSCKDNDVREGEMVGPDGIEAEPTGTAATDAAADTTSRVQEDSLIETPSP